MIDDETDGDKAFGYLVIIILIPVGIIIRGWVLTAMWGWFIVPFGLEQIGMAHALGLSCCTALFARSNDSDKKYTVLVMAGRSLCNLVLSPVLVLGIGWTCHYFM